MLLFAEKGALLVLDVVGTRIVEEDVRERTEEEPVPVGPAVVELPMVNRVLLVELRIDEVLEDPMAVGPAAVLFATVGKGALLLVSIDAVEVVEMPLAEETIEVVLPMAIDALLEDVELDNMLDEVTLAEMLMIVELEELTTEGPLVVAVLFADPKGAEVEELLTIEALVVSAAEEEITLELAELLICALPEVTGAVELEVTELEGIALLLEAEMALLEDAMADVALRDADADKDRADEDVKVAVALYSALDEAAC